MKRFSLCLFLTVIWFPSLLQAQGPSLSESIPMDPQVIHDELDNGLDYYIRRNSRPENRAQLWLVVNAGSILENEDQRGLAHFLEHMAFNGTKNFEKHELINYLESIGMKFGPEINAYTGFDETVFMLHVPADSVAVMDTAFQILEDWAHNISLDPEEIEKERGVVIEEWRSGRGANMRMLDEQLPVLFKDSRYAERLPIGKKEILEKFDRDVLKSFYEDWYRPDLMAVIAVGDFYEQYIEDKIKEHFGKLKNPEDPRKRFEYPVPGHEETLFALATDPEATNTLVSVYFKSEIDEIDRLGDYRRLLMERLFTRMINNRLYELLIQPDPPFLYGFMSSGSFVRTVKTYSINAGVEEDKILSGLEAVMTEVIRVRQYGFTETELARIKTEMLRDLQNAYEERDKTRSSNFAREYRDHFLEQEPAPGIKYEYRMARQLLPGIQLREVNALVDQWLGEDNRVVMLSAPEKEGLDIPDEKEMLAVLNEVEQKEIEPYSDEVTDEPLLAAIPEPAEITAEQYDPELDLTILELSNGVKVWLKPTDFKNDEVVFTAFSPGGTSLMPDTGYVSARVAADIIYQAGAGAFDQNALNKKLTGRVVTVFPYISNLTEGFTGNASVKDMETMFQLIYLYTTTPRKDPVAFASYRNRLKGFIENRNADPEQAFYDTLMVTLARHHPRRRPWSTEILDEMKLATAYSFYTDRFADASDFTFIFVGSFKLEDIKPLVKTCLGNLPFINREESWKDHEIRPPQGVVRKQVVKGIEPWSRVQIVFHGDMDYSRRERYALNALVSVLRIKLREVIREDQGGTYGVGVTSSASKYPREAFRLNIAFGCDPERVEELTGMVFSVLDNMQRTGPEDETINKVSETQKRSYETQLKENSFWLNSLEQYAFTSRDPGLILQYPDLVESLDIKMVREAAQKYIDFNNYVKVVLYPEAKQLN